MYFSIKIDQKEFKDNFFKVFVPEVNKYLKSVVLKVQPQVTNIVKHAILDSPEVQSLFGGKLQAELGVIDPQSKILAITNIIGSNSKLTFSPAKLTNNYVRAGFELNYIQSNYDDLLAQPEATQATENGYVLQWLEWLLIHGDTVIVAGWDVGFDPLNYSRTGLGKIMYKGAARNWSVPPEFAGTQFNNFITRSLDTIEPQIEQVFQKAMI